MLTPRVVNRFTCVWLVFLTKNVVAQYLIVANFKLLEITSKHDYKISIFHKHLLKLLVFEPYSDKGL